MTVYLRHCETNGQLSVNRQKIRTPFGLELEAVVCTSPDSNALENLENNWILMKSLPSAKEYAGIALAVSPWYLVSEIPRNVNSISIFNGIFLGGIEII